MGCGASNTTGKSADRVHSFHDSSLRPTDQLGGNSLQPGVVQFPNDGAAVVGRNIEPTHPNRNRRQPNQQNEQQPVAQPAANDDLNGADQEIEAYMNNPNFFYNEDYMLQAAMQQSLVETNNNRPEESKNEEELFNELLNDALVASKKDYDDIDRKAKEDELQKIKDDPEAMQKKMENLLSDNRITSQGKKLPPLSIMNKNLNSNKTSTKQNLALGNGGLSKGGLKGSNIFIANPDDAKGGNDTESDVGAEDDKNGNGWNNAPAKPSYNPQLLNKKDESTDKNGLKGLISLESQEIYANDNNVAVNFSKLKSKDSIEDLMDDIKSPKHHGDKVPQVEHTAHESTADPTRNTRMKRTDSKDSFDDLIDGFDNTQKTVKDGPPGAAVAQVSRQEINYDEDNDSLGGFDF